MSLTTLIALCGAFTSVFALVVGATALGARWLGRADAERELADAKKYALAVDADPKVVEYRTLQATTAAYRSADRPVAEWVRRISELVSAASDKAAALARTVQRYGERLNDAERVAANLPGRLERPRGPFAAADPLPPSIRSAVASASSDAAARRRGPAPSAGAASAWSTARLPRIEPSRGTAPRGAR